MKLAIIDLGTNSLRLDIHRVHDHKRSELLHREKRMVRLGDGVYESGRFSKAVIERGRQAFIDLKSTITDKNVDRVVACATSAMRSASNAQEFIELVRADTAIEIKIISGQQECELISRGIVANEKLPAKPFLMVDIGGGSTEISYCKEGELVAGQSFQLGANRLQQNFLHGIPPASEAGVEELRKEVQFQLKDKLDSWSIDSVKSVMGSSGTIRALSRIIKKRGVHTQPFRRKDLSALIEEIQAMDKKQLLNVPGLEPRRVDLILAGALLLEEILLLSGTKRVFTTNFSLRDGILNDFLENHQSSD